MSTITRSNTGRYLWRALATLIVLTLVLALTPGLIFAQTNVSLTPTAGPPGTLVTISGTGFIAGNNYSIRFAPGTEYDQVLLSGGVVSGTTFTQVVNMPFAPRGTYTVAVNTSLGNWAPLFTITPSINLSDTSGSSGDTVVVNGSGFRRDSVLYIMFDGSVILQQTTSNNGSFTGSIITIPTASRGDHNISANDGVNYAPSVIFTITPDINVEPISGAVNDSVTLRGSGFASNSLVSLYWDGDLIGTDIVRTDAGGGFTYASYLIPASSRGVHTILARDSSANQATSSFTVGQKINLSITAGAPTDVVTVTGAGFRSNFLITMTFGGQALVTSPPNLYTNPVGSFSASFVVPGVVAGQYVVKADDGLYSSTVSFTVRSGVSLNTTSGNIGSSITLTGSGFTPGGRVAISYDTTQLTIVTAASDGTFNATFDVPPSKGGQHTISASDLASTGAVRTDTTFSVETIPPPKPNLLAPENGSQASRQTAFDWSDVADPSGVTYQLQVASDANFSSVLFSKSGLTNSIYQLNTSEQLGLTKKDKPFYWRVKAVDGAENDGGFSAPWTFYTQESTAPPVPALLEPQNATLADPQTSFDWTDVSDPSGVTYQFQVGRDSAFNQVLVSKTGLTGSLYQLSASEELPLTKADKPFYWRVKAVDGAANESAWSAAWAFFTVESTPPPVPAVTGPQKGKTVGDRPKLEWTPVTDPSGVVYELQIAADANFVSVIIDKPGLKDAQYQLTDAEKLKALEGKLPYYWRIRATDGAQNISAWSPASAFYIGFVFSGWVLYVVGAIGGILLLAIGVFIGRKLGGFREQPI